MIEPGILYLPLIAALEIYDANTATKVEAFEKLLDTIKNYPEDLQNEFIEKLLQNDPTFFKDKDNESSDKDYQ